VEVSGAEVPPPIASFQARAPWRTRRRSVALPAPAQRQTLLRRGCRVRPLGLAQRTPALLSRAAPPRAAQDVDLGAALNENIQRARYEAPTPVQKHAIPVALAGRDLMACAQVRAVLHAATTARRARRRCARSLAPRAVPSFSRRR
jgi:hypothetical protein